jgi:hypothetical protein
MKGRRSLIRRFRQAVFAKRHRVYYDSRLPYLVIGYDVHPGITEENFPREGGENGEKLVEFWLFPGPELGEGYIHASLRELLVYHQVSPESFRKYRVLAMRRGIEGPSPGLYYPFIQGELVGLISRWFKPGLRAQCVFLGVKYPEQ